MFGSTVFCMLGIKLLVAILFLSFLAGFCFGCLFLFACSFLVCVLFDWIAHWTVYWSITSAFEAIDV